MTYWLRFVVRNYWPAFAIILAILAGIAGRMVYDLVFGS